MYALVYNPLRCSRGKCEEIESILKSRNIELKTYAMTGNGDSEGIRGVCERCERVIVAGGDGSVHRVVNATRGMDLTYAIVPMGTGNDLARAIGTIDCGIENLVDGSIVDVDSWIINDEVIFLTAVAYGLSVEVNNNSKKKNRKYTDSNLSTIMSVKPIPMKIVCDGKTIERNICLLNIQNIKYIGGGMLISTDADYADGLINIVICENGSKIRRLLNAISTKRSGLDNQPNSNIFTGKTISIELEDGNI